VCCSVVQCGAVWCSVVQCVAEEILGGRGDCRRRGRLVVR